MKRKKLKVKRCIAVIGKQIGAYTVLEYLGSKRISRKDGSGEILAYFHKCRCRCGNIITTRIVHNNKPTGCKKCRVYPGTIKHSDYPEILRLRNEGKYYQEIADVFGCTRERIRQILYKLTPVTLKLIKQKKFEQLIPEIEELYINKRYTYQKIADTLNIPVGYLYSRLIKSGRKLLRVKRPCSFEGCDRMEHIKGFCDKHYGRFRWNNSPGCRQTAYNYYNNYYKKKKNQLADTPESKCSIEGCNYVKMVKGFCSRHYMQQYGKQHNKQRWQKLKKMRATKS